MTYFEAFAGVGGFSTGIHRADPSAECVGFSEIDKYASAVLEYHYPKTKNYGDISKINWSEVPDFDLLVGGSPCQDLSIAGKRAGLQGSRSGLFEHYVRALKEKKPQHFIWENVKGALSSNGGRDFAVVLDSLAEAGYSLWWQVLNAKDFGVPQNRERIFVVGSRTGSPREILFERGIGGKTIEQLSVQGTPDAFRVFNPSGLGRTLKGLGGGTGAKTMLIPTLTVNREKKRQNGRRFKEYGDPMFTLTGQDQHGVTDGLRIRRLTPTECERLMSWPDGHTKYGNFDGEVKEISDSQRYKMCGNGVVSEVVRAIVNEHLVPIS